MGPPSTSGSSRRPGGALSSVISSLSRGDAEDDGDLDRYIADVLLAEAQQADPRTASSSSRAPQSTQAASTNKRFLASVIRNVDGHNRAVLRAQEDEAREGQRQRGRCVEEDERQTVRGRGAMGAPTGSSSRQKGTMRGWSDDGGVDEYDEKSSSQRVSPLRIRGVCRRHDERGEERRPPRRSASPPRRSDASPPSKMDRYFTSTYDPLLDVSVERSTDPTTGLIDEGGWDGLMERVKDAGKAERRASRRGERRSRGDEKAEERGKKRSRGEGRGATHRDKRERRSRRDDRSESEDGADRHRSRRRDEERSHHRRERSTSPRRRLRHRREEEEASPGPQPAPKARAWDLGKST